MHNAVAPIPRVVRVERRPLEVRVPGRRLDGVRHVAVVREDRLGDFVLALPAIERIGATYPDARLSVVVDRTVAPLAATVPGLAAVLATDRTTGPRDLARRLRAEGVDTLVAISRRPRAPLAALIARLDRRVGSGGRWWSPLLSHRVDERRRGGARHELEYALSFAHAVGAQPAAPAFPFELPAAARAAAAEWRTREDVRDGFVVLHPGSGGSCPAWPARHWGALAHRLAAEGVPVVASIGPADESRAAALVGHACFRGDLVTLAALLDRAALVVSNSTGPLHLAAALDTPTLALHAPWASCAPARWGPYSPKGWTLVADDPAACRWSRGERRRRGADLLGALAPDVVLAHVRRQLDTGRP